MAKQGFKQSGKHTTTPVRHTTRLPLRLEALEDRLVPAAHIWQGTTPQTSNWSNPANWVGGNIPNVSESAIELFFFTPPESGLFSDNDVLPATKIIDSIHVILNGGKHTELFLIGTALTTRSIDFANNSTDFTNLSITTFKLLGTAPNETSPPVAIVSVDTNYTVSVDILLEEGSVLEKLGKGQLQLSTPTPNVNLFVKEGVLQGLFTDSNVQADPGTAFIGTTNGTITLTGATWRAGLDTVGAPTFVTGNVISQLSGLPNTIDVFNGKIANVTLHGDGTTIKDGGSKLVFTIANDMTGDVIVHEGILSVTHPNGLGNTSKGVQVNKPGRLSISNNITVVNEPLILSASESTDLVQLVNESGNNTWNGPLTLSGSNAAGVSRINSNSGQMTLNGITSLAAGTLYVGGAANTVFTGPMNGAGGMVKDGEGILILNGTKAYTGNTLLHSGTTRLNGILTSSDIIVDGTGVLEALGTMRNLTMNAGGSMSPGLVGAAGLVAATGAVNFNVNSMFVVDIASTHGDIPANDQLVVSSRFAVNLSGSSLVVNQAITTAVGDTFLIINRDGTVPVTGFFKGPNGATLGEGAIFSPTVGGPQFKISYVGGTGNDVVLTRVNSRALFPNRSVTPVINEGERVVLTGVVGDPDQRDSFFLRINWGDGSPVENKAFPPYFNGKTIQLTHRYRDNSPAEGYNIQLSWKDQHGEGNSGVLTTVVNNVAPKLRATGPAFMLNGNILSRQMSILDPGQDTWHATIDYGDDTASQELDLKSSRHLPLRHRYLEAGQHTVTVAVQDDDGGVDTQSFTVNVTPSGLRTSLTDTFFALLDNLKKKSLGVTIW